MKNFFWVPESLAMVKFIDSTLGRYSTTMVKEHKIDKKPMFLSQANL